MAAHSQFKFAAAGYFTYFCSIHDSMLGAVSVPMLGVTEDVAGVTHFKLTVGVARLPVDSPYRYVLLRQQPGEASLSYWKSTRSAVVDVVPSTAGDYSLCGPPQAHSLRPAVRHQPDCHADLVTAGGLTRG